VLVFGWRLRLMAEILESGILYFHLSQSADGEISITAIPADTKNAGRRGLARTHEAEARARKKRERKKSASEKKAGRIFGDHPGQQGAYNLSPYASLDYLPAKHRCGTHVRHDFQFTAVD